MHSNEELDLIEYFENTINLPLKETERQYHTLYKKDEIFNTTLGVLLSILSYISPILNKIFLVLNKILKVK